MGKYSKPMIIALLALALFAAPAAALPGTWAGYVSINGSTAANGTIVTAHVNNASTASATFTIGTDIPYQQGYYLINLDAALNDNITFKVNGVAINGTNTTAQPWYAGLHYVGSSPYFNLTMALLANGESCSYSNACSSSNCAQGFSTSGKWCEAATSCADSGVAYANAATTCSGSSVKTCSSGTWTTTTCAGSCSAGACVNGGGGGAGGGGGGAAPAPTAPTQTTTVASISPETPAIVPITNSEIPVSEISIDVKAAATNVAVTVSSSSTIPSTISIAAPGNVYSYLTITVQNLAATNIDSAKVKFTVPRSWLTANGIDVSTIALNRFADSQWGALPTTMLSSDANNYYFEATTPGFSVFAVTGQKAEVVPPAAKDCRDLGCPATQECKVVGLEYKCVEKEVPVTPPVEKDCRELGCPANQECKLVNNAYVCLAIVAPPVQPPVAPPTDYTTLAIVAIVLLIVIALLAYFLIVRKPKRQAPAPVHAKHVPEEKLTPAQRVARRARTRRDGGP